MNNPTNRLILALIISCLFGGVSSQAMGGTERDFQMRKGNIRTEADFQVSRGHIRTEGDRRAWEAYSQRFGYSAQQNFLPRCSQLSDSEKERLVRLEYIFKAQLTNKEDQELQRLINLNAQGNSLSEQQRQKFIEYTYRKKTMTLTEDEKAEYKRLSHSCL